MRRALCRCCVAGLVCLAAVGAARAQPDAAAAAEFDRLNRECYRLLDSIESPERWREAVAQRKAFLETLRKAAAADPALAAKLARLIASTERSIEYDGAHILSANGQWGIPAPLGDALDVVAWVEDDQLRAAVGNPGQAPRKARIRLAQSISNRPSAGWPAIASAEVEVAPEEVVSVRFEGLPTVGEDRHESDYEFRVQASLVEPGRPEAWADLPLENLGALAGEGGAFVRKPGPLRLTMPPGPARMGGRVKTAFVPREARARRSGAVVTLRAAEAPGLIPTDHGWYLTGGAVAFTLDLPAAAAYDLVAVAPLFERVEHQMGHGLSWGEWWAAGPRIIVLGARTRARDLAAPLDPAHRFDAKPLAADPAERARQFVPRFRTELWGIRANAEAQVAVIGKPAVAVMVEILARRGADASYGPDEYDRSAKAVLRRIGEPAVDDLAALMRNPNWRPSYDAAELLGRIGGRGVDALLAAAADDNPKLRTAALKGLYWSNDPRRVAAIRALARDPDQGVRRQAEAALPQVVGKDEGIALLVADLDSPDPWKRRSAVMDLGALGAKEQAPRIARLLKDADADVRLFTAGTLAKLRDPETVPALVDALQDPNAAVRKAVSWAIRSLPSEAIQRADSAAFVPLLFDSEDGVRGDGAALLGRAKADLLMQYLVVALNEPSANVRRAAKGALESLGLKLAKLEGDERYGLALPEGVFIFSGDLAREVAALGDANYYRRDLALALFVARGEAAVGPLTKAMGEGATPMLRLWAVRALAGIDSPAARDALRPLLASNDRMLAYAASESPGLMSDEAAKAEWARLLSSDDFVLRMRAAEALGKSKGKEATGLLVVRLGDGRAEVRRKAIQSLGERRDPAAVDALFERFVNRRGGDLAFVPRGGPPREVYADYGEHAQDLDALADALVKIGAPAVPRLVPAVEAGFGPVEEKAASAIARIGAPAIPALIAALASDDDQTRNGAAKALAQFKDLPAEAVPALVAAAGRAQYAPAFDTLAALGARAKPGLAAALADPARRPLARASAAMLLAALGDNSGLDTLREVALTGSRGDSIITLQRMGRLGCRAFLPVFEAALDRRDVTSDLVKAAVACGGKDARPILEKALDHPDATVRKRAQEQLDRLDKP